MKMLQTPRHVLSQHSDWIDVTTTDYHIHLPPSWVCPLLRAIHYTALDLHSLKMDWQNSTQNRKGETISTGSSSRESITRNGRREAWTTHITELHHSDLSQFADAAVGRLWLEVELGQGHLLTSEEFPHDGVVWCTCSAQRSMGSSWIYS